MNFNYQMFGCFDKLKMGKVSIVYFVIIHLFNVIFFFLDLIVKCLRFVQYFSIIFIVFAFFDMIS